jgi:hypothetical protein
MTRYVMATALLVSLLVGFSSLLRTAATGAENPEDRLLKEDLASIQGAWELTVPDDVAKTDGRIVKHIRGNRDVGSHYTPDGKLCYEHVAEIELRRSGPVQVHFYSLEVTLGPDKGAKSRGSFIYKVMGDTFYEIGGVMIGEEKVRPYVMTWRRLRET